MQFKKTPLGKRITYTYKYADGHSVTLHSGQDGVVEADISQLYAMDDSDLYYALKAAHRYIPPEQKAMMKQWRQEHPGEPEPDSWQLWNVSFDAALYGEEGSFDDSHLAYKAWVSSQEPEPSPRMERVFDFIETLPARQQRLLDLAFVREMPQKEIAAILKIKPAAVSRAVKRLRDAIQANCY